MKQMLKLGLILMTYTAIACVGLAFINNLTSPAIAANEQAELNNGLKSVFFSAESFEKVKDFESKTVEGVSLEALYLAKNDGNTVGCVVKASGPTYDKATILAGVDTEGKITSVEFLELTDTPGFGQKAKEPKFADQFKNKSVTDRFETKSDVEIISGATITTVGVVKIIKVATKAAAEYLAK
ncbi:MAG: FMN-binding protein [Treponema sp.]|nr:FMN-binding protein [Treponema sp.]